MFVASEDATSGSETKEIEDNVQSHKSNVRLSFLLGTCCNPLCNANRLSCVNEEVLMHARRGGRLVSSSLTHTALTSRSYFQCVYLACSLLTNLNGVTLPVIQKTERISPLRSGSSHCFFCSSDPYKWRTSMLPVSRGNNTNTVIKRNGHRKHNWSCPLHRHLGGGTLCTASPSPWKKLICFRGGVAVHSIRVSRVHRLPIFPFEAAFLNNFHQPKCPQTSNSNWLTTLRWNWSRVHDHNGLQITLPSSLHLPFFQF